jgi:hypothetical protein
MAVCWRLVEKLPPQQARRRNFVLPITTRHAGQPPTFRKKQRADAREFSWLLVSNKIYYSLVNRLRGIHMGGVRSPFFRHQVSLVARWQREASVRREIAGLRKRRAREPRTGGSGMKSTRIWLSILLLLGLLNVCARGDMTLLTESRWAYPGDTLGGSEVTASLALGRTEADASGSWGHSADGRNAALAGRDSILSSDGITSPGRADRREQFWPYEYETQPSPSALHAGLATDASSESLWTDRLLTRRDYHGANYRMYSAKLELSHGAGIVFSASVDPDCRPPANGPSTSTGFSLRTVAAMISLSVPLP